MIRKEKKILVVEDDKNLNRLISYNLSKNGFTPESIYDGLEANTKLSQEIFDIVVLDIMLPGIDGFHICKAIKENPAAFKTFVVMLTARAESQDKIYGNLVGADCYITKPFSVAKLMEIIKELISMRDKDYFVQIRDVLSETTQGKKREKEMCPCLSSKSKYATCGDCEDGLMVPSVFERENYCFALYELCPLFVSHGKNDYINTHERAYELMN
ncbi:MAG: response regulator [Candidatus Omnitrophica bacterium]|nr:response regulator [Candidatus Omnitrophota bacterium]